MLLGLSAFASNDTCATRLGQLYAKLPKSLKLFGDSLGDGTAEGVRSALKAQSK